MYIYRFLSYQHAAEIITELNKIKIRCGETSGGIYVSDKDITDEQELSLWQLIDKQNLSFSYEDTPLGKHLREKCGLRRAE